jgi:tetratricopeptide (TPR) repeat protein
VTVRRRRILVLLVIAASVVSVLLAIVVNVASGSVPWLRGASPAAVWITAGILTLVTALLAVGQLLVSSREAERLIALDADVAALLRARARPSVVQHAPAILAPATVPHRAGPFVGREAEIAAIGKTLVTGRDRPALVGLSGKPGVGKSVLALEVAGRLAERYPDGRLFLQLNGMGPSPLGVDEALGHVLGQLGADPESLPARRHGRLAVLRSLLGGRRVLFVFDDARNEQQVRPLVPSGPNCGAILTSRRPLVGLDLTLTLSVETLPREDSVRLLATASGRVWKPSDRAQLERIAHLCGDLPLALRIAAALLRVRPRWSATHLIAKLEDEHRLDVLRIGDVEVRASIAVSYRELDDEQQAMFRRLGLLAAPTIPLEAAATLLDQDAALASQLLEALVDAQLLDSVGPDRYALHDLLRLYARERAVAEEEASERGQAVRRAITAMTRRAWQATSILDPPSAAAPSLPKSLASLAGRGQEPSPQPGTRSVAVSQGAMDGNGAAAIPSPASPSGAATVPGDLTIDEHVGTALDWFEQESSNLVPLVAQAAEAGDYDVAVTLAVALCPYLQATGRITEALTVSQTATRAADLLGDEAVRGLARVRLGIALQRSGGPGDARAALQQGASICRSMGLLVDAGRAIAVLGHDYREKGEFEQAEAAYRAALELMMDTGLIVEAAGVCSDLGQILKEQNRLEQAAAAMERTLELAASIRSSGLYGMRTLAWARENLGAVRKRQGRVREAIRCHVTSYREFEALHDPTGQGFAIRNLGDLLAMQNRHGDAIRLYELSLERFEQSGSRIGVAQAWASIAAVRTRSLSLSRAATALYRAGRSNGLRYAIDFAVHVTLLTTMSRDTKRKAFPRRHKEAISQTRKPEERRNPLPGASTDETRPTIEHPKPS